jgi:hypothetical protein
MKNDGGRYESELEKLPADRVTWDQFYDFKNIFAK